MNSDLLGLHISTDIRPRLAQNMMLSAVIWLKQKKREPLSGN